MSGRINLEPENCPAPHLEGFDERPKQSTDALPPAEELHQTHDSKQAEEGDGDASAVLRVLGGKESGVRGVRGMSGRRWQRASGCALQEDGVQTETLEADTCEPRRAAQAKNPLSWIRTQQEVLVSFHT